MARSALHRTYVSPRVVAVLGAVVAGAIALAASVNLGRPLQAARAEAERGALSRADGVRLAWQRVESGETLPWSPRGLFLDPLSETAAAGEPFQAGPKPSSATSNSNSTFDLLLDAALLASGPDSVPGALEFVLDALARDPGAPRAAEAHLLAARLCASLGDPGGVEEHRAALLRERSTDPVLDGTSIALLSCLVQPVDAAAAFESLSRGALALPAPQDEIAMQHGELVFRGDPWWGAIQRTLASSAPELPWDAAFQRPARETAALESLAATTPFQNAGPNWQWLQRGDGWIGFRRASAATQLAAFDPASIANELEASVREAVKPPYSLKVQSPTDQTQTNSDSETLVGPEPLAGGALTFKVLHEDPEAQGRRELQRQSLLRIALLVLSCLVLATALLAARALARARRLAELRSTFVASVSHDLRTPTQAILLLAETLEQNRLAPPTPENRARYHGRIRKEAERLRRLIEDLLDSARIDRGKSARIYRTEVDQGAFFDELERSMAERAEAVGAPFTLTRSGLSANADLDPEGVRRAIWNLFENALLHGRRDGNPPRVEVNITEENETLTVTIEDDGPGIPARYRESAFTPFERLRDRKGSASDIATDTGTGLGLAIVRSLARAHGGDARVLENEGGARITVSFSLTEGGEVAA